MLDLRNRFGTIENPDLEAITREIKETYLRQYAGQHGSLLGPEFSFGDCKPMQQTPPEKPYSALTDVPLLHQEFGKVGTVYILFFRPGDGTGDTNTYTSETLVVPPEYQHDTKPERVYPRSKSKTPRTLEEGFLPFFSFDKKYVYPIQVSLEELGIKKGEGKDELQKLWDLGIEQTTFRRYLANQSIVRTIPWGDTLEITLTTGTTSYEKRFGDPHAIYAPRDIGVGQVGGFLAVLENEDPLAPENPLVGRLDQVAKKPRITPAYR